MVKNSILDGVETKTYSVKLAESNEEVDQALRLRFEVFGHELKRGFNFQNRKDYDKYDDQCQHLIVVEKPTQKVIGTYRLQTIKQANAGEGFYTSKRFKIEQFPKQVLTNGVEVGRACIKEEHRNGRVLYLLWKGMAGYLEYYKKRYLFGYSAFDTNNPNIAFNTYQHLKKEGHIHPDYQIEVKNDYKCIPANNERTDKIDIPPLFQNYLDVGTKICSLPAQDKELELIHVVILLDVEAISERTKKMFFG